MIYAVLDNILIIILTAVGLFSSRFPELFIISAGALMVLVTYESFNEEKSKTVTVIKLVLMTFYSLLSGVFSGFLIFFLLKEAKLYVRIITGAFMFVFATFMIYKNVSVAMCLVYSLILVIAFLIMILIYYTLERSEERKNDEKRRITASSVSELHEKRLNEKLKLQNYMAEKNARLLERENISRNIHNSVGHSITAAIITLDAADMLYDVKPDEARKKMNDANSRIRGSLESIRQAVRVLDEDNAELTSGDLKSELDMVINEFVMDTSISINRDFSTVSDEIKIPHDHAVFFTGVLQEMLTNGVKHGGADWFLVILLGDTAHIRLEISDNGKSDFSEENSEERIKAGFGIKKIISYVKKCGGKTGFENDNGFKSVVELPLILEE